MKKLVIRTEQEMQQALNVAKNIVADSVKCWNFAGDYQIKDENLGTYICVSICNNNCCEDGGTVTDSIIKGFKQIMKAYKNAFYSVSCERYFVKHLNCYLYHPVFTVSIPVEK